MKPLVAFCAATLVAATLTACESTSHEADMMAVKDTEVQWNQDWASRDLDKIMAHYADDAVLMVPGGPSANGKSAIREGIKAMAADPATSLKFTAAKVEIAKSGDVAWTQGTYTLTLTDPQTKQVINDHGSYVTTYRKQPDGSWKAVADIATSEVPPSAPTTPASK